eukprot:scaffold213963_cov19-Prasinocladus_malaysianus.AAC.1
MIAVWPRAVTGMSAREAAPWTPGLNCFRLGRAVEATDKPASRQTTRFFRPLSTFILLSDRMLSMPMCSSPPFPWFAFADTTRAICLVVRAIDCAHQSTKHPHYHVVQPQSGLTMPNCRKRPPELLI